MGRVHGLSWTLNHNYLIDHSGIGIGTGFFIVSPGLRWVFACELQNQSGYTTGMTKNESTVIVRESL